jgi:hypothetical protein
MKKPKTLTIKKGLAKGWKQKAVVIYMDMDGIDLPCIEGSLINESLDELICSNPQNAREIGYWLLDWAEWAQDFIESDPKRVKWLKKEGK